MQSKFGHRVLSIFANTIESQFVPPQVIDCITGYSSTCQWQWYPGRVADPNHAYHCKEKKLLALAESQLPNVFLASTCQGTRQQIRSCHAALPTPPWRRPRLEGAQCPARRDRCLPHHHPRRAARAEPPRCATRRAARALPPRQPPPSRAAQPPHVRGGAACNLEKTPPSDFFATFK